MMYKHFLITAPGGVEPTISGPLQHYGVVQEAARKHYLKRGHADTLFSLTIDAEGNPSIDSFSAMEIEYNVEETKHVQVVAIHAHLPIEYLADGRVLPNGLVIPISEFYSDGTKAEMFCEWKITHIISSSGESFEYDNKTSTVSNFNSVKHLL